MKILTNVITGSVENGFYMITFKLSNQTRWSLPPDMNDFLVSPHYVCHDGISCEKISTLFFVMQLALK
jgi:hypothetical protein